MSDWNRCQKCGACCRYYIIEADLVDVLREPRLLGAGYAKQQPTMEELEAGEKVIMLALAKSTPCPFLGQDNRCTIYETRPIMCRSYPLGFNGQEYYLKNDYCKGLNKKDMTKEQLDTIRNDAFEEYIAHRQTDTVLPIIYGMIFNKILKDSQSFMEKLSDSDESAGDDTVGNDNDNKNDINQKNI